MSFISVIVYIAEHFKKKVQLILKTQNSVQWIDTYFTDEKAETKKFSPKSGLENSFFDPY